MTYITFKIISSNSSTKNNSYSISKIQKNDFRLIINKREII